MKKIIPLVAVLMVQGVNAANAEDVNAKLQELQQALAKNPDDEMLLGETGFALYKAGKYDEAEPLLKRSLKINEEKLGKSHKYIAINLASLGTLYYIQGKYNKAEPLFKRSLEIDEKVFGKEHLDVVFSLNNLARIYEAQENYKQAEILYIRSLDIKEKKLGKENLDVADALDNLARIYEAQESYKQAEQLYIRSLSIKEKSLGKEHPDVADSLNNLGLLYGVQDKYDQAESLLQRALAVMEKSLGEENLKVSIARSNLAANYKEQGNYGKAEILYKKNLAIAEKNSDKNYLQISDSLKDLAFLYVAQSKYETAEPLLQKSLEIKEKILGKTHPDIINSLNNLIVFYETQGKDEQAELLYKKAFSVFIKTTGQYNPNPVLSMEWNLTKIKLMMLGKKHPYAIEGLNRLAISYQSAEIYESAEFFYKRSIELAEKAFGKNSYPVAIFSDNLAGLYRIQSKYSQAEKLHKRSLDIFEKTLGTKHPEFATALDNLAILYRVQKKYQKAEYFYKKSWEIRETVLNKNHPHVSQSLKNLAYIYNEQGKYTQAEPLLKRLQHIISESLLNELWNTNEEGRQSYLEDQEAIKYYLLNFYSLRNIPIDAFNLSLLYKGILLRIGSQISTLAQKSSDQNIQKQTQEIKILRSQLSTLFFSGKDERENIKILKEKVSNLELELGQSLSRFKNIQTEVTSDQILTRLKSNQILVDFLIYKIIDFKNTNYKDKHLDDFTMSDFEGDYAIKTKSYNYDAYEVIALIADKQNGIKLIKLGSLSPIVKSIKTYQSAIVPTQTNLKTRLQILPKTAQTLYQQLWQPLTPHLQNKKTVYLVSDGYLNLLPFKALQDPDGKYLAEKWQLITLSSARDIVLPPLEGKANAAAIFAAPDYGDDTPVINLGNTNGERELSSLHFNSLANALNEGQQIDKLFRKKQSELPPKIFLKAQATEKVVTSLISPRILHLSTHTFFMGEDQDNGRDLKSLTTATTMTITSKTLLSNKINNPLTLSGLAFANANFGVKGIKQADGTDGILTALEVLNLDLAGTDLVTLSACDAGKGDVKIGEGVYSLNRAFQEAGAKAVLSTLWQVSDQATAEFMQKFYTRFLNGEPAQQAIQATQQEFMHHKDYSNPYYWAGFVMTGKD